MMIMIINESFINLFFIYKLKLKFATWKKIK